MRTDNPRENFMTIHVLRRALMVLASALALVGAGGAEAAFRAYLASNGLDTDPCTLQQPCRLLPAALAAVDPGGEIWMLDSANFNTGLVNVTKSVTILAVPGAVGSVVANGADAMLINAVSVKVILRNLVFLNLSGASNNGIYMTAGASLTVIECQFTNLGNAAIYITDTGMKGQIVRSNFVNNGTAIRVFAGVVSLIDNNVMNSIIAVEASGSGYLGPSGAGVSPPTGPTRVYVSGGNLINSNTVFHMESPGTRAAGQCNGSNIFIRTTPFSPQILTYTNQLSVTGAMDQNPGCVGPPASYSIDQYNTPWPS
jgi:hypothetical protein